MESEAERGRLLTALVSLMNSEEVIEMVEKMLDAADELLLDLPYLQRVRQQGKEEGLAEGKEEGLAEGKEEGLAEGISEGLREAILEAITIRFDPVASQYRQVNELLNDLTDRKILQQLLAAAIQVEDMATFTIRLNGVVADI